MAKREKPRMSKAHYELLASALKAAHPPYGHLDKERVGWVNAVNHTAYALIGTNPLFDKDKFLAACGVS